MPNKFQERLAALGDDRVKLFVESKSLYRKFADDLRIQFPELGEGEYVRARNDPRLEAARQGFIKAIELSEDIGKLPDVAVARYQLGMVCHMRGELDEAADLMRNALEFLDNLPGRDYWATCSGCHYHIGIVALKQRRWSEADQELHRSRSIDESIGDLSGVMLTDEALAKLSALDGRAPKPAPQTVPAPQPKPAAASAPPRPKPVQDKAAAPKPKAPREPKTAPQAAPQATREVRPKTHLDGSASGGRGTRLIWLASYSDAANDSLLRQVESLEEEFGRPVAVARAAVGSSDPHLRLMPKPDRGQKLTAAILVIEKAGLVDQGFRELVQTCVRTAASAPSFRLLVYLRDLSIADLQNYPDSEGVVESLFATTQLAQAPTVEDLRATLVEFVRAVDRIELAERWRTLRLRLSRVLELPAIALLLIAGGIALLGFPAAYFKVGHDWLGPYGPALAALVLGTLAFPLQAPLIYLMLRGLRTTLSSAENSRLMYLVVVGLLVTIGASNLQQALDGPWLWLLPGLVIGVLLDAARRAGMQARREMIEVKVPDERAANEQSPERLAAADRLADKLTATLSRRRSFNPLTCPLLPSLSARVFISYTRKSARSCTLAEELYRSLREKGADPFLDRKLISVGANWRHQLSRRIVESDTVICIVDEMTIQSQWVASELEAAVEGRRLTGSPQILVLLDPAAKRDAQPMPPAFRAVMRAADEPMTEDAPQVIELSDKSLPALVWGLAPGRFLPPAIFTRTSTLAITMALVLLSWIGAIGGLAGVPLGVMVGLDRTTNVALATNLADAGLLAPLTLLSGFWLGFLARTALAWGCEIQGDRERTMAVPALATAGVGVALPVFLLLNASVLVAVWSVALVATGWAIASAVRGLGMRPANEGV